MLHNIYETCLAIGIVYTLVSIVLNGLFDGIDLDSGADGIGFDGIHLGELYLPIKPFTVMLFVSVFGGIGLISLKYTTPIMSLIIAILIGATVSNLMYYLIFVKLKKYETTTSKEEDALFKKAKVLENIPADGFGRISYVINGNTITGVAKNFYAESSLNRGDTVYIAAIEGNTYIVCEDLNDYFNRD